jgi:hypothetical protein
LLSFNCSSFACKLNCVQRRCLSFAGVMASLCGPMGNPWIGMSLQARHREDQGHIIGLDVKPLYHRVGYI